MDATATSEQRQIEIRNIAALIINAGTVSVNEARELLDLSERPALFGQPNWNNYSSSVSIPNVTTGDWMVDPPGMTVIPSAGPVTTVPALPNGFTVWPVNPPATLPPPRPPVWNEQIDFERMQALLAGINQSPAKPKRKRAPRRKVAIEVVPLDAKRRIRLED